MKQADIMTLLEEAERIGARIQEKTKDAASQPNSEVQPERVVVKAPPMNATSAPAASPVPSPDAVRATPAGVQTQPSVAAQAAAAAVQESAPQTRPVSPPPSPSPAQAPASLVRPEAPRTAMAGEPTGPSKVAWHEQVPVGYRATVSKGLLFVFGFLVVFAIWASVFPIHSAVVAAGKVISSGQNKLIQHPNGGVVRDILIVDGDRVEKNDLIVTLDKSMAQAELSRLMARRTLLTAQKARYLSEQAGRDPKQKGSASVLRGGQAIADSKVSDAGAAEVSVMGEQRREFTAGRARLTAQLEAIEFQVETLRDQKSGLEAQIAGSRKLLEINTLEIGKVKPLVNDGFLPKARLWELEKVRLELLTNVDNFESQTAATEQRILEAQANLAGLEEDDREKNAEELTRVIGELAEIKEPIVAARAALEGTDIRAPASGTIVNLVANTKGGVVAPGAVIAEVVPNNAGLEVEFRVPLEKSKNVYVDQEVRVVVTTFNRRTYDAIDGKVSFVSADSLVDEQSGENFFLARAKLTPNPEKNTGIDEVTPGMATEVYVLAAPRVFASYLAQPIVDSFNRAFREN